MGMVSLATFSKKNYYQNHRSNEYGISMYGVFIGWHNQAKCMSSSAINRCICEWTNPIIDCYKWNMRMVFFYMSFRCCYGFAWDFFCYLVPSTTISRLTTMTFIRVVSVCIRTFIISKKYMIKLSCRKYMALGRFIRTHTLFACYMITLLCSVCNFDWSISCNILYM